MEQKDLNRNQILDFGLLLFKILSLPFPRFYSKVVSAVCSSLLLLLLSDILVKINSSKTWFCVSCINNVSAGQIIFLSTVRNSIFF